MSCYTFVVNLLLVLGALLGKSLGQIEVMGLRGEHWGKVGKYKDESIFFL